MLQAGRDLHFASEARSTHRERQIGAQHLDRHLGVVAQVAGEIHRGHAATADLVEQLVTIGQSGRERILRVVQTGQMGVLGLPDTGVLIVSLFGAGRNPAEPSI